MVPGARDITSSEDIQLLVHEFYTRAFQDELLRPIFVDVAKMDLAKHMPTMIQFWSTVLLGARTYRGGAFAPHALIHREHPLTRTHFDRWLSIWRSTVDELFTGAIAEDAKLRAQSVAYAFHRRLNNPEFNMVSTYPYPAPTGGEG